jgi:hypothetical protein
MTFGTQWSSNTTLTSYEGGDVAAIENLESEFLVDAYGALLLPGGITDEALRIRETTIIDDGPATVAYYFWTNSGAILELYLTGGQDSPNSGMVETLSVGYGNNLLPLSTTERFPEGYGLINSFPNPFRNSFTVDLNLFSPSDVSFVISDIAGKILKNELWPDQAAGSAQVNINANDLPPGVYIGTLSAGSSTQSIKLIKSE